MNAPMLPVVPGSSAGPMTVGRILDRIFAILRSNLGTFIRLGAVPVAVLLVAYGAAFALLRVKGLFPRPHQAPDSAQILAVIFPAILVALVPMMVAFAVFQAAACHASIQANRGRRIGFRQAYGEALRDAGRYVWLMVLQAICVMLPVLVTLAAAIGGVWMRAVAASGPPRPGTWFFVAPLIMLAYLLTLAYAVWMTLRLGLAFPACVEEKISAVEALKRSGYLTRQAKGRMFVVLLVVYAISYAAFLVVEFAALAVIAIVALIGAGMHLHVPFALGVAGVGILAMVFGVLVLLWMALIWAGYAISLSVLYEDQVARMDPSPAGPVAGEPA